MSNKIATNKYIRDAFISAIDDSVSESKKTILKNSINENIGDVLSNYMGQTNTDLTRCMRRDNQAITTDTLSLSSCWGNMTPYDIDYLYNDYENPFYDVVGDAGKLVSIGDIESKFNINKTKLIDVTNNNQNIYIRYTDNGSDTFNAFDSTVYVGISTDHYQSQFMLFDAFQDVTLENSMDISITQPRIDNHLVVAGYAEDWEPGDNIAIEIEVRIDHPNSVAINSMPIILQIQENNIISIDPHSWDDDGESAHGMYYTNISLEDLKSIWEIDLDMNISNTNADTWGTIDFSDFYFLNMAGSKISAPIVFKSAHSMYPYAIFNEYLEYHSLSDITINSVTNLSINTTYLDKGAGYYVTIRLVRGTTILMAAIPIWVEDDGSITPCGNRIYLNIAYPSLELLTYSTLYGNIYIYGDPQALAYPFILQESDSIALNENWLILDSITIDLSANWEGYYNIKMIYPSGQTDIFNSVHGDWYSDIDLLPGNVTMSNIWQWAIIPKTLYIEEC